MEPNRGGIQNRRGALFFLSLNSAFSGVNNAAAIFPAEKPVFLREVNNNMYSVSSYFFAKVLTETPLGLMIPFVMITSSYWLINLNDSQSQKYPMAVLILTCSFNCFSGIGYILGIASAD